MGGAFNAQRIGVLVQGLDHAGGQSAYGFTVREGALNDLVIDVGDVAHIGHLVASGLKPALHHIECDHRAGVPEVAEVVYGHAADIHAHMSRLQRRKRFQITRQRVVDA